MALFWFVFGIVVVLTLGWLVAPPWWRKEATSLDEGHANRAGNRQARR